MLSKTENKAKSLSIVDESKIIKQKTKPELMQDFCKYMKLLAGDLKRKFPTDNICFTIYRKITVAVDHLPERILRAVGKYLVKYSEQIESANYDFFLKSTFGDDFPEDREMDEKEKLCMYTIELVKQHWSSLDDKEKKDYHKITLQLLYCYCDFIEIDTEENKQRKNGGG